MNRRTKYYKRSDTKPMLAAYDLLSLFYAGDEAATRQLESLWAKHEDQVLSVWRELFPGTRPALWWYLNYPDVWQELKAEAIRGHFHLPPEPEAQRAALTELGELDGDELFADQRAFSFEAFLEAYRES